MPHADVPAGSKDAVDSANPGWPDADLCSLLGLDRDGLTTLMRRLAARSLTVATAESLTAGLLAATLTEIPGSSAVFRGGIVCYATDLKHSLVGVDAALLADAGPVDPRVAAALANGARDRCGASLGVGLTGVAGPDAQGGKPPGTVFVAATSAARARERALISSARPAGRWAIRAAAVRAAIDLLEECAADPVTGSSATAD